MVSFGNIRLVLAIIVTLLTICIVATIAMKGSRQISPPPVIQQLPRKIDVVLDKARFTEVREGVTVWELVADQAQYDKSGEIAYLTGIKMKLAGTGSKGGITATAAKGEYQRKNSNVMLRGAVHVVSDTGIIFDSESVDYVAAVSMFKTAAKVTFSHQRLALTAKGMEMDISEQKARFLGNIDATLMALHKAN